MRTRDLERELGKRYDLSRKEVQHLLSKLENFRNPSKDKPKNPETGRPSTDEQIGSIRKCFHELSTRVLDLENHEHNQQGDVVLKISKKRFIR